jgi:hypothetical protein
MSDNYTYKNIVVIGLLQKSIGNTTKNAPDENNQTSQGAPTPGMVKATGKLRKRSPLSPRLRFRASRVVSPILLFGLRHSKTSQRTQAELVS